MKSFILLSLLIFFASCSGGGGKGGGGGGLISETGQSETSTSTTPATPVITPKTPSSLEMVYPITSPGIRTNPTLKVLGVAEGQTVKLFKNSGCSDEIASGIVSGGTFIQLTIKNSLEIGTNNIYAVSVLDGKVSACTGPLTYNRVACPANTVPMNSPDGKSDFCVSETDIPSGATTIFNPSIIFPGLTEIVDPTDSTLTLNWDPHPLAQSYEIFDVNPFPPKFWTSVSNNKTSITLTDLKPNQIYKFVVRVKTADGYIDPNSNVVEITTNPAPNKPAIPTLVYPTTPKGIRPNPTFRVSGVKVGDTVRLYKGEGCVEGDKLSEIKVASGTSVDLTVPLNVGTHKISAAALNSTGASSGCGEFVSYQRTMCPDNYVPVNSPDGASDFCVAKYEMKRVSTVTTPVATSQKEGTPWVNINFNQANSACDDLGEGFDIIQNSEWMMMAKDVEKNPSNWVSVVVDSTTQPPLIQQSLIRGHSDNDPKVMLAADVDTSNFGGTKDDAVTSPTQRRTFNLSNGSVVWDIAGNAEEWVNSSSLNLSSCIGSYGELLSVKVAEDRTYVGICPSISFEDYEPGNPNKILNDYNSSYGIGQFYGGTGMGIRGGKFQEFPSEFFAGIFALRLDSIATTSSPHVGFRCVYRLPSN